MLNKILFVSLLAFVSLFFISCEKDYSCERCGGVLITGNATYSLNGGTSACTGAVVSGDFIAGAAVTSANTVVLNVVVDSVGSYAVTTNSVNGISFSGAGFFTTPGAQTITLRASGTPVTAGNFNFTAGNAGCSFTVIVVPVIDNNFVYYFEATIDGTFYKETVTTTNGNEAGSSSVEVSTDDVVLSSNILPTTYPPMPAGKTGMAISKGILYSYSTRNNTEFKTFFNLGNYFYTNSPSTSDGVNVTWYDQNGIEWKTDNAPADQSGSNFEIVNVADVVPNSIYTITVTFTFNCKLYDATGNVKILTGGRYKGEFVK